jgi:plastocyanin
MRLLATLTLAATLFAFPALAASHTVEIKGMKFSPAAITVAAGDTITFVNKDGAPHTATAKDGSFDTGRLSQGDSATVTIGGAGSFDYICKVHPAMKGNVTAN